jgi:hypothetical protein
MPYIAKYSPIGISKGEQRFTIGYNERSFDTFIGAKRWIMAETEKEMILAERKYMELKLRYQQAAALKEKINEKYNLF